MVSEISSLSLRLYLNLLVYDRNIFGSSSNVFGNLRKFSENVRQRSRDLRANFGESSEIFGKCSKIFGKLSITNFMFSWQEQIYHTHSLRSLVRYCSCHSNIKFISSHHRVISSMYVKVIYNHQEMVRAMARHLFQNYFFNWRLSYVWNRCIRAIIPLFSVLSVVSVAFSISCA